MSDFAGALFVRGEELIQALPIASGSVVEVGDMVKLSGGAVEACGATTDNLAFIGVAKEAHAATDGAGSISVAIANGGAVYKVPLDAAASPAVGSVVQLYTSAPSKKVTGTTSTDPVAMVVRGGTSVSDVEVVFFAPNTAAGPRLVGDAS